MNAANSEKLDQIITYLMVAYSCDKASAIRRLQALLTQKLDEIELCGY